MFGLASFFRDNRRSQGRGKPRRRTILNVESLEARLVPSASPTVNFAVTQDWGSGFQAQVTIADPANGSAVSNWQLAFTYSAQITDIWDASIVSHTGNQYVIENAGWNSTLAPGGTVSFGFNGSPGNTTAQPSGCLLDGIPLGAAPPPVPLPTLSIANASVTEPASGTATESFAVTLSAASSTPVTVQWQTQDGTARVGADYQAASGTLTFAAGQTQQDVVVTIDHDSAAQPGSLAFSVDLASPSGATLATAQATGTITVPTPPPPPSTSNVQFQDTSDWGSGFTGQITINNPGSSAISSWTLQFTFGGQITSIWDAQITSHTGNVYVVSGASWDTSIAAGSSVSFGFNGSPGNVTATTAPGNFILGEPGASATGAGNPGSGNTPPTAVNDTAFTTEGQPVTISVLANDSAGAGETLSLASIGTPQHGSVVQNANNTVTYTPDAGFTGSDSFTYVVSDSAGTARVTVTAPVASTWPQSFFSPYVDATAWPLYNFVSAAQTQGLRYFTLAFVTAGPNDEPAWGGYQAYDVVGSSYSSTMQANIVALRALGGDVMVSFGGAAGQELAQVITSVPALTAAYESVITTYNLTHIDFDIEGAAEADQASIDRRSQAIAALQQQAAAAGRQLDVYFTLPVLPTGLTADGLYVLQSALKYGVQISGVNIMTMDYGDSAAPNPAGQMGTYAIDAATSLFGQLQTLYGTQKTAAQLWHMVGITPMIGVNDVSDEVFTQQNAQQVLAFAEQMGIDELSMWSLNRDQPGDSGITQQAFDFSTIFEPFTSG
jgi:Cellulose binding domain/Bacterial Ig domain/Calx-beta domain